MKLNKKFKYIFLQKYKMFIGKVASHTIFRKYSVGITTFAKIKL